ncbi:hypothetical protein MPSEU_000033600 [Mayamaea pseudoterrestris]|nr:hypothetical protein MPSEU_000033600 [Mayamaea pseudoterrestris]
MEKIYSNMTRVPKSTLSLLLLILLSHDGVFAFATSFPSTTSTPTMLTPKSFTNQAASASTTAIQSSKNDENIEDSLPRGGDAFAADGKSTSSKSSSKPSSSSSAIYLPANMPALPTLKQFQKFAIPCLALWIAGPLLSLVDTSFVGLSGTPEQSARLLAALGPATTFFDGATYLFCFLNVATTNLYSSARAQYGEDSDKAESVVRTASRVSIRCGLGLMVFLLLTARPLLKLYIGTKAASTPGLLDAATDYVHIRALSMPTSLLLGVLQASLLGAKDSVTPLVAVLYATLVNLVGDYVLVKRLKMGLQGAAIATTIAQWASTYGIVVPAKRRLVRDGKLGIFVKKAQDKNNKELVTTKTFLSFAAPVLTLVIGKLAAFGFMTHSAAAVPGQPTPLAAHQIILSMLFSCSPFLEVISQTAQTFLPPFLAPVNEHVALSKSRDKNYKVENDARAQSWLRVADKVSTQLLGIGFVCAAAVASIASLVPAKFSYFLTSDLTVQNAVKPLAKYLWMGAFFWAPVAVAEGVLLARRELGFLAFVYLFSTALLPAALLQVKFRQGDVGQVWACFVAFQLFRATCFVAKVWGPKLISKLKGEVAHPVNGEIKA